MLPKVPKTLLNRYGRKHNFVTLYTLCDIYFYKNTHDNKINFEHISLNVLPHFINLIIKKPPITFLILSLNINRTFLTYMYSFF